MRKQFGMTLLVILAVGCGNKNGTNDSAQSDGQARKINMTKGSSLVPSSNLRDLDLGGDQVNVYIQSVKSGSTYLTYLCDVRSFSLAPTLELFAASVGIDFKDATQVNCAMAAPDGAKIVVSNARQANISMIGAGTSLDVTTNAQTNLTIAVQTGTQYSFNVTGLQVNGLGTCAPYTTTAAGAPSIKVNAALQANVTCIDINQAHWVNPILTDPDTLAAKAIDGNLL